MPSRSVIAAAHAAFQLPRRLRRAGPLQRLVHVRVWGRRVVPGVTTPAADRAWSSESAGCSRLRAVPGMPRVGVRPARPGGMSLASGVCASGLATGLCGDGRMPAAAIGRAGQAGARAATAGPGAWVGGFPAAYRGRAGTGLCAPATGGGRGRGRGDGPTMDARASRSGLRGLLARWRPPFLGRMITTAGRGVRCRVRRGWPARGTRRRGAFR
jgi:hypothetical protein